MLDVSNRQLYETMKMLSEYGYVKGMEFMDVISLENSVLNHPRNWHITSQG
ncbi:YjcQ family protein [Ligilactobacillus animalis]|nr:YjcQ family protein [Ligilactobacillus animalis]